MAKTYDIVFNLASGLVKTNDLFIKAAKISALEAMQARPVDKTK